MKKENIIQQKSFDFSIAITKFCSALREKRKETIISKQLQRSGTSVGANVEEGIGCQSRKDFYFRFTIAYKEARESHYWLRILRESQIDDSSLTEKLISDCEEVLRIIGSILKTVREKNEGV